MKILILYDNFIRDYRGLLLLKKLLIVRGHKVWMRATWNNPLSFAAKLKVDVIVGGQIAEASTHYSGKFAKENKIRFVLNATENVGIPENFQMFVTYNTTELNDDMIDLQTVASRDVYNYIQQHPGIKSENKYKYKFLGFPRIDLTVNQELRAVEIADFKRKYNLPNGNIYLFISSFLLDGAYDGVPQRDLEKWNYSEIKHRTAILLKETSLILTRLIDEILENNDILLIKKHPWDCSSYFKDNFRSKKTIILDNTDYIVPCLLNSDFILHTYSTSAIEAWVLNKKTISILSDEYRATFKLNHMNNELTASSFEELCYLLKNYPPENPSKESLNIFEPFLDGRATERLVEEICALTPYRKKRKLPLKVKIVLKVRRWVNFIKAPKKSVLWLEIREWLTDKGLLKYDVARHAKPNTKSWDFYTWENSRAIVIRKYNHAFKRYARQYIKRLKSGNHADPKLNHQREPAQPENTFSER